MTIGLYNLLIPKGTTVKRAFRFWHTLVLAKDLLPTATSVRCDPLPAPIASGTTLIFRLAGCQEAIITTTASASLGAESLSITAYSGVKLPCQSQAKISPVDLTGKTFRAAVRRSESDLSPLVTPACTVTAPTSGSVEVLFSKTQTTALLSNCTYNELPQFQQPALDFQDLNAFDPALLTRGYYWDLESEDVAGEVSRHIYGRVFVPWEAAQ